MNGNYITTAVAGNNGNIDPTSDYNIHANNPANNGGIPTSASYHYHSSRVLQQQQQVVENGYGSPAARAPPPSQQQQTFDDVDSNGGVDSGQGSSLDRDYSSYNRYNNAPGPGQPPPPGQHMPNNSTNPVGNGGGVRGGHQTGGSTTAGQYYYNLPNPRGGGGGVNGEDSSGTAATGGAGQGGISPRRRAPGDTLDLSNREYRGSAFELYKKPGGFQPFPSYGEVQR